MKQECNHTLERDIQSFVAEYMNQFDPSHDYAHIQRVLHLAQHIQALEQARKPQLNYDTQLITLASLLHDIGDHKYQQDLLLQGSSSKTAEAVLIQHGAEPDLARRVQRLVSHVSYSAEVKDPESVQRALIELPELAVVQDADRLDALGAVGIARCFAYAGARRGAEGLEGAIRHFGEKLGRLKGLMKTEAGREMAEERARRLEVFKGWWDEEVGAQLAQI